MNEQEILDICFDRGWTVDFGDLISGPYIPDGTVRIYEDDNPYNIVAEGATLQDAVSGLEGFDQ